MNLRLAISEQPLILILMVLLMNQELKFSTIKITTGLTVEETRHGIKQLIKEGLIEKITRSSLNPTFRMINQNIAKSYLENIAKRRILH
ncbi:MAG: hypothetical protein HeimC2_16900 [Candidatus Heimdallarchaeota archaeon LC_2]|nr:MAG: hypothetical protein HeimC2_16900 [Candidatus Heimdallarchaeota archaeon LC_2]